MATEAETLLAQIKARQSSPAQRLADEIRAGQPTQSAAGPQKAVRNVLGTAEAAGAMGTGLLGQIVAGGRGIAEMAATGQRGYINLPEVAEDIRRTQEALTFEPKSAEGRQILQSVGEALQEGVRLVEAGVGGGYDLARGRGVSQAADTIEQIRERGAGDVVMERTGSPGLATAAELGVDAALLAPGLRAARGGRAAPPSAPSPRAKLTGAERDALVALQADAAPELVSPFRGFAKRREEQINALSEARLTAQQVGDDAVLADVGGPNMRGLAEVQGAVSREGQLLRDQIVRRDAKVRDNMVGLLDDTMFKGRTLRGTVDDINTTMRDAATPLYREAYAQPVTLTPELTLKLREPAVLDGIKEARKLIGIDPVLSSAERTAALSMFEKAKGGGWTVNLNNVNMRGLDFLKRGMDDVVSKVASKKQRSTEGRSRSTQAAEFRDVLVGMNPKYGEALNAWSTGKRALEATESGRVAFNALRNNTKSAETLIDEFNALPAHEQALYRVGAADFLRADLRRKPDLKSGETPASVFTSFAGSPAQKQLLARVFENADDFRKFERLMEREGVFSDTLKAVNVGDARQVALQQALSVGELPKAIAGMGTDVLFAMSNNRFALLNLIQNAFTKPKQFLGRYRSTETAKLTLGKDAKTALDEMIGVLETQQQMAGTVNRMKRVAALPPKKLFNWLKDEKNRRKLYAFGTAAAVTEEASLDNAQEQE